MDGGGYQYAQVVFPVAKVSKLMALNIPLSPEFHVGLRGANTCGFPLRFCRVVWV
jgi:hypothetical protein